MPRFVRRQRERQDLLVVRKATHHLDPLLQVPQDRNVQPALELRAERRVLLGDALHAREEGLRKDMRKDVELEHGN